MARNILKAGARALVRRDLDRRELITKLEQIAEIGTDGVVNEYEINLCLEALKTVDEAL